MCHDLLHISALGLGYLLEYDQNGHSHNACEHEEHVVGEQLVQVGKGDGESQVGHPVHEPFFIIKK